MHIPVTQLRLNGIVELIIRSQRSGYGPHFVKVTWSTGESTKTKCGWFTQDTPGQLYLRVGDSETNPYKLSLQDITVLNFLDPQQVFQKGLEWMNGEGWFEHKKVRIPKRFLA